MMEQDMTVAPGRTHKYYTGKPRVEFGAGLSYSKWNVGLKPESAPTVAIATSDTGSKNVTLSITNKGPLVGDAVILAFLVPKTLSTQPGSKMIQKLWQFSRVADVAVGATMEVSFAVDPEAVAITDLATGDIVSAPGSYTLSFRDGSGASVDVGLEVTGKQHVIESFPTP